MAQNERCTYFIQAKVLLIAWRFIQIYCTEILELRIYYDNITNINISNAQLCIIYRRGAAN
jgi:hypothetical protein